MLGNFFCAPKTNKQTERQKPSTKQEVEGVFEGKRREVRVCRDMK